LTRISRINAKFFHAKDAKGGIKNKNKIRIRKRGTEILEVAG
jgi:hypothetical protein